MRPEPGRMSLSASVVPFQLCDLTASPVMIRALTGLGASSAGPAAAASPRPSTAEKDAKTGRVRVLVRRMVVIPEMERSAIAGKSRSNAPHRTDPRGATEDVGGTEVDRP